MPPPMRITERNQFLFLCEASIVAECLCNIICSLQPAISSLHRYHRHYIGHRETKETVVVSAVSIEFFAFYCVTSDIVCKTRSKPLLQKKACSQQTKLFQIWRCWPQGDFQKYLSPCWMMVLTAVVLWLKRVAYWQLLSQKNPPWSIPVSPPYRPQYGIT